MITKQAHNLDSTLIQCMGLNQSGFYVESASADPGFLDRGLNFHKGGGGGVGVVNFT